ncbi:SDR family oxidoreductase [Aestuariibacter sp. A3R04]|uniref:SDR family oxidoreductase n=1 Tax=Aestuariibacter sp. A3R04 TaxID=2841571 RepID=UPI001C08001E|nr:SDR family oxidoreductase [Aestuariibacter sp. A3R04]MBU3023027.1 SDR family oxidoreductase [Aestuariibacter sp. A3R04]
MKLVNSTAVISGGASGLGLAAATYLSHVGAKVALLDVNAEHAKQALTLLPSQQIRFYQADVTSDEQVCQAINSIKNDFGGIDLCVNCAGIAPAVRVLNKSGAACALADYQKVININLVGTFNVARLCAQVMASQPLNDNGERGVIINTASIAAYEGQIGQAAYASSKAGIVGLTLPMARDLASSAIRVNAIAPGIMATPLLLAMPEKVQGALAGNVPFPQRLGEPSEFAKLVGHIAENSYINGEVIRLDGALRMQPK